MASSLITNANNAKALAILPKAIKKFTQSVWHHMNAHCKIAVR